MTQIKFPKTVEQFIDSDWHRKIYVTIIRFRLKEDPADTMQDILTALFERKYLERWDAAKGSYSGWLYAFVHHELFRKYRRSNSRGGRAIENAHSLDVLRFDDNTDSFIDLLGEYNPFQFDFAMQINEAFEKLSDPKYRAWSHYTWPNGWTYERDMRTIFYLIVYYGVSTSTIAYAMQTTLSYINSLIRRMRPILSDVFDMGLTDTKNFKTF